MGRFYKTGKGDYIDFIYKQPRNLLLQAVKTAEGQIDQQAKMNADLYGQLHSAALPWDAKKRDLKLQQYRNQIDATAQDIQNNPLAYRKSSPRITTLTRQISDDLLRGELASYANNVKVREDFVKRTNAMKNITEAEKQHMINRFDKKFKDAGGTSYENPYKYNTYETGFLADNVDMLAKTNAAIQGWNKDYQKSTGMRMFRGQDGHIYTETATGGIEYIDEGQVRKALEKYFAADQEVQDYYNTRIAHGVFGKDIAEGQKYKDAAIKAYIDLGVDKAGVRRDMRGATYKANAYYMNSLNQLNAAGGTVTEFKGQIIDSGGQMLDPNANKSYKMYSAQSKELNSDISGIAGRGTELYNKLYDYIKTGSINLEGFGDEFKAAVNQFTSKWGARERANYNNYFRVFNKAKAKVEELYNPKIEEITQKLKRYGVTGADTDIINNEDREAVDKLKAELKAIPKLIYDQTNQLTQDNLTTQSELWATTNIDDVPTNAAVVQHLKHAERDNALFKNNPIIVEKATGGYDKDGNLIGFKGADKYGQSFTKGELANLAELLKKGAISGQQLFNYELIEKSGLEVADMVQMYIKGETGANLPVAAKNGYDEVKRMMKNPVAVGNKKAIIIPMSKLGISTNDIPNLQQGNKIMGDFMLHVVDNDGKPTGEERIVTIAQNASVYKASPNIQQKIEDFGQADKQYQKIKSAQEIALGEVATLGDSKSSDIGDLSTYVTAPNIAFGRIGDKNIIKYFDPEEGWVDVPEEIAGDKLSNEQRLELASRYSNL